MKIIYGCGVMLWLGLLLAGCGAGDPSDAQAAPTGAESLVDIDTSAPVGEPMQVSYFVANPPQGTQYTLVWSDEFSTFNTAKWMMRDLAQSTGYCALNPAMVTIQNGALSIVARKIPYLGKLYSCGRIETRERISFSSGYFEVRAKMSSGSGMHTSIWMWPANDIWPPEIDLVEWWQPWLQQVWQSVHWFDATKPQNNAYDSTQISCATCVTDYHIYAVEWSPELLVWYMDGRETKRMTQHVPATAMYFIMDSIAEAFVPADASTDASSGLLVDYVRIYRKDTIGPRDCMVASIQPPAGRSPL